MASSVGQHNPMAISFLLNEHVPAGGLTKAVSRRPGQGRLLPEQPSDGSEPPILRFCHNAGYWLRSLAENGVVDGKKFEILAGVIKLPPDDLIQAVGPKKVEVSIKRSLCARILIGMAVIHEHNLRGVSLNQRGETHPACRPDLSQFFKCSNLGISQAQMVLYGTDVGTASALFKLCVSSNRFPCKDDCPDHRGGMYTRLVEIEKYLPQRERRRLYEELLNWYISKGLRPELQFWLPDQWDSPYNVRPPPSNLQRWSPYESQPSPLNPQTWSPRDVRPFGTVKSRKVYDVKIKKDEDEDDMDWQYALSDSQTIGSLVLEAMDDTEIKIEDIEDDIIPYVLLSIKKWDTELEQK